MFQPISYQEKRATLNEVMVQQLAGLVGELIDTNTPRGKQMRQLLNGMLEQYARTGQTLRDQEAKRVLGEFTSQAGQHITSADILEYMKANLGRTYFPVEEHTSAPDGAIGTAGFGTKFQDWVQALPSLDANLLDIQTGFYADLYTVQGKVIPALVIRDGNLVHVISYRLYLGVMTLSLDNLPEDYNRDNKNHYYLRGEMFSYRGDMSINFFTTEFEKALKAQKEDYIFQVLVKLPSIEQAEAEKAKAETSTYVASQGGRRGDNPNLIQVDESGYVEVVDGDSETTTAAVDTDPETTNWYVLHEINFYGSIAHMKEESEEERAKTYKYLNYVIERLFAGNPCKTFYDASLALSAAYHGPGDAFAWKDLEPEDIERLAKHARQVVAEYEAEEAATAQ